MIDIVITVFNDHRVKETVASIQGTSARVLLTDGGSNDGTWELCQEMAAEASNVEALQLHGSVAETRAKTMPHLQGDIVVFLDADETVPPHWLQALIAPIQAGDADVTGGPTRPLHQAGSRAEAYVNAFDDWFYEEIVAKDAASLPMGNSAWRRTLLEDIGGFDPLFAGGGEDYDVNLRARAAGARFQYVADAWTWHDQSHLNTLSKLYRRMRNYAAGATCAYLKNGQLKERSRNAVRASRFHHPYQPILFIAKMHGYLIGRRRFRSWK